MFGDYNAISGATGGVDVESGPQNVKSLEVGAFCRVAKLGHEGKEGPVVKINYLDEDHKLVTLATTGGNIQVPGADVVVLLTAKEALAAKQSGPVPSL